MIGYHYTPDELIRQADVPSDGILSRTLLSDDRVKLVIFGFDTGQELSEHTSSMPATLYFVKGEATVTLGDTVHEVGAGSWVYMEAGLTHAVVAKSPVVLLLTLVK
jgi:quercetin dioxygenase-like cupin family protein